MILSDPEGIEHQWPQVQPADDGHRNSNSSGIRVNL